MQKILLLAILATAYTASNAMSEELSSIAPSLAQWRKKSGATDLHEAIILGKREAVRNLLAAGANPNAGDKDNINPIHYAAHKEDLLMIELLLRAGADINAINVRGQTALHYAVTPGNIRAMQLLLIAQADPNISDINGNTPLFYAAKKGITEAIPLLREFGAQLDKKNCVGNTPLFYAADYGTLEELLNAGAHNGKEGRKRTCSAPTRSSARIKAKGYLQ